MSLTAICLAVFYILVGAMNAFVRVEQLEAETDRLFDRLEVEDAARMRGVNRPKARRAMLFGGHVYYVLFWPKSAVHAVARWWSTS